MKATTHVECNSLSTKPTLQPPPPFCFPPQSRKERSETPRCLPSTGVGIPGSARAVVHVLSPTVFLPLWARGSRCGGAITMQKKHPRLALCPYANRFTGICSTAFCSFLLKHLSTFDVDLRSNWSLAKSRGKAHTVTLVLSVLG